MLCSPLDRLLCSSERVDRGSGEYFLPWLSVGDLFLFSLPDVNPQVYRLFFLQIRVWFFQSAQRWTTALSPNWVCPYYLDYVWGFLLLLLLRVRCVSNQKRENTLKFQDLKTLFRRESRVDLGDFYLEVLGCHKRCGLRGGNAADYRLHPLQHNRTF